MDYEQEYKKTIEQLYLVQSKLTIIEREKDDLFNFLDGLHSWYLEHQSNTALVRSKKDNRAEQAERYANNIRKCIVRFGSFYFESIYHEQKCAKLDSALLDAAKKISELENRLKILEQIDSN